MCTFLLGIIVIFVPLCIGTDDSWYRGCIDDTEVKASHIKFTASSVADCAEVCFTENFLYVATQGISPGPTGFTPASLDLPFFSSQDGTQSILEQGNQLIDADDEVKDQSIYLCYCFNISTWNQTSCNESLERHSKNGLPVGFSPFWAVYTSMGPYLTTVTIETDAGVATINSLVAIEIHVNRLTALNITNDERELGHHVDIVWMVRGNGTRLQDTVSMKDYVLLLHRPRFTFTQPGNYTIDVKVSNGISTRYASLDLEVVYPAPRNLQITIPDDLDLPSCIPEQFKVTEEPGQTFAVFVDVPVQFDASVAMGTDLTFTFQFEDTTEDQVIHLCENCTSARLEHVFQETGMFHVVVYVDNVYGHVDKNLTVLVIERLLSNLTFDLDPGSDSITPIGQPVNFVISLLTTSRTNRSLQVWYGNGQNNIVSLSDTMSPRLVIVGDGKEMEIIASYGEGCRLLVEFQYIYETEGLYTPRVVVFENEILDNNEKGIENNEENIEKFKLNRFRSKSRSRSKETINQVPFIPSVFEHSLRSGVGSCDLKSDDFHQTCEQNLNKGFEINNKLTEKIEIDGVLNDEPYLDEDITGKLGEGLVLSTELDTDLLILDELVGARIRAPLVARCQELQDIKLLLSSDFNVTVHWSIFKLVDSDTTEESEFSMIGNNGNKDKERKDVDRHGNRAAEPNEDLELVYEEVSSNTRIMFLFSQVGDYIVTAVAENAFSSTETSVDILVQCPIEYLEAKCTGEFIETGTELLCLATVQKGSDIVFHWSIEGLMLETYTQLENHTSLIRHRFNQPGIYDISVTAVNNVSKSYYEVESLVSVQNAIKNIHIIKKAAFMVGTVAEIYAVYEPKYSDLYYFDVSFDFDFGNGREHYGLNSCDEMTCWEKAGFMYYMTGSHEVTVYAYNEVSEVSVTEEILVFPALDEITIQVLGQPVAQGPIRFLVMQNGKTMETADVYFTWLFKGDSDAQYTNSPLVEVVLEQPGNYTVFVNITNRVDFRRLEVPVYVSSRSDGDLQLLHDLYVTPGTDVNFDLQGVLPTGCEVSVRYSDGAEDVYREAPYQWVHRFTEVGTQQISVSVLDPVDSTLEMISTYIMIQEPVQGLYLTGPTNLAYQKYETTKWTAVTSSGTNIMYNWTLDNDSIVLPNSEYEIKMQGPGTYTIHVQAFNDVSKQPIYSDLSILVENVIEDVEFNVSGNIVGKPSKIVLYVPDYLNFMAEINFGDGEFEVIYSDDPIALATQNGVLKIVTSHIYEAPGEYNITVNVSNSVSSLTLYKLFIPIEKITLKTRSPWVTRSTGHVVVKATVKGGDDLRFTWNFSDSRTYEKPVITSYPNQTSVAKHFFGMSGEYCVTFTVTGHNYQAPGVSVMLDRCFLVVDPIEMVKLSADSNSSALEGNSTPPVIFTAKLSGSHVVLVFDYGDGTREEVPGSELYHWNKDLTMFAKGRHSFTAVGKYKVKVTAINPLGNQTVELPFDFWVQEPPRDLRFCDPITNTTVVRYVGKVGEVVAMSAKVSSGTDVMFNWKLGDQTDLVKKGCVISHQYMMPGMKTVYVAAYNKVRTLTREVKVYINYEIQGVVLSIANTVFSVGKEVDFSAVVKPEYPGIVNKYEWTFKPLKKKRFPGRGGSDIETLRLSQSSQIPHTFLAYGEYTVTVTVYNAISYATSPSIDIYVHLPIKLAEIYISSNKTDRLVNQPIRFKYHAYSGTHVNLTWTFGDQSDPVFTTIPGVEHTFTSEGVYNVTVLAQNPVSSQVVSRMLFILTQSYCVEPEVSIIADVDIKIFYSQYYTFEVDVETDCNLTSVVAYHWSIDGHVTSSAVPMDKRVLVLPPRMLNYGMHVMDFRVEMVGTIVFGSASRSFEVIATPLVSKIHGGIYRLLSNDSMVLMDGSGSFDPDSSSNKHLGYYWKCHYLTSDGTYGESCFLNYTQDSSVSTQDASTNKTQNSSCTVAMDTDILLFPKECLEMAANYTFELTVFVKGRQNGSSFQTIAFEQENSDILDIRIVRPYIKMDPVNADRKLSFYVECSKCETRGTTYTWSLRHLAGYNVFNYARAHDLPCVDLDGNVYSMFKENETDSSIGFTTTTNIVVKEQNPENNDGIEDALSTALEGAEIDFVSTTTEAPMYPYGPIAEGKPGEDNRRHRSSMNDLVNIDIPRVEEQQENFWRTKTTARSLDIVEEIQPNEGRGVPRFQVPIEEGTPGESGSSGGRQYSYGSLDHGRNNGRDTTEEPDYDETGSGLAYIDKLQGSRKEIMRVPSILELPMVYVNLPHEQTKTGLDGESLVIKPGFLKQGLTYFLEVKVNNEETGQYGKSVSSFVVNESPVHGRCSIKPESGIELDTEFTVVCKEWQDEHKPLMYEVSYNLDQSEDRKLVYRGVNAEIPFRLPAGSEDSDFIVYVYISILDGLLAKTTVCSIPIRVTPRTGNDQSQRSDIYADAKLIYEEITSPSGSLQKSVDNGDDAMSKVSITYLASWLNRLNDSAENTLLKGDNVTAYIIENSNATYITDKNKSWVETDAEYRKDARRELLKVLESLPVRDEAEVLQSAQALAVATAVPGELDNGGLYFSLKVLEAVCRAVKDVYFERLTPTGELVELVVRAASSIIQGTMGVAGNEDGMLQYMYKDMIDESIDNVQKIILNELQYQLVLEEPVMSSSDFLSVWASRHSMVENHTLSIGETSFQIPPILATSIIPQSAELGTNMGDSSLIGEGTANQKCVQSHMTSFKLNPYDLERESRVHSVVGGLTLFDCEGRPIIVENLHPDDQIHIDLPNIQPKDVALDELYLNKWSMNVHQFNISTLDLQHALHIQIEFTPVTTGRLFPITVWLSFTRPPSPDFYQLQYDFQPGDNNVDIFLPAGSFNATGMYYIGIVDSTYNSNRLRPGQVTQRSYTLKLWWGQCLYWNKEKEVWLSDGCTISQESTFEVTKCRCNHLTSFGGRFELIPNKLTLTDIEGFFSPHRNPVTLTLISVVVVLYCLLFIWCYREDLHDNRKGGIVYLLDNSPMDQQKFEITLETGCWRGAGTTAKISIILHGEEGMSETRELISEDDRPMFERNSRDKFILSLPDSIGRIWKVQIWHNNFGPSPSWFLSRVIVRDLNSGNQFMFICEKWLAVEEQDGKVEREFMILDSNLQFTKAFSSKAVEYMADFHTWMSLVTCPHYSGFMRTERLTVCLTMLMAYMCLNAMWYKVSVSEYRGEFGLLDVSWRNVTVGAICCAVVIPLGGLLEFLFRRSKPKHASSSQTKDEVNDWEAHYPSGKPNEQESEDSSEQVQPIMTYSLLDQSILNWPNIQSWAQKQWIKRQMTGRPCHDSHSGNSSSHSGDRNGSSGSATRTAGVNAVDLAALQAHGITELDQASSGFEDCSSLIRPKASVDSTHTTAAPSVNESTRVHKPQSLADSLRISTKLPSESDFEKSSKAPSISSSVSHKSSVSHERRKRQILGHLYLPYWCRYIAWALCATICLGCATVTIMYGYRFGILKSTLWLQSLYFSIMICVFISNPLMILIVVVYAAWSYSKDPATVDHYGYDIFNRQKAKDDLVRWKKQLEAWDDSEALERGVAARQRSRYLRFARPPQEKQLIEARKRVMKEKKAIAILKESAVFIATVILLLIMAYSKDVKPSYYLNTGVKDTLVKSGDSHFSRITSHDEWYGWARTSLLQGLEAFSPLHGRNSSSPLFGNTHMIGQVQLRQQKTLPEPCSSHLPYVHTSCLGNSVAKNAKIDESLYTDGNQGDFMFGWHGIYDGSGYVSLLNSSRSKAEGQIENLRKTGWLDRQSRAVFVELTLYNTPSNLFTTVKLLAEMSTTGSVFTTVKVTSTQLFRYVTMADNVLLACELLFFVLMMLLVKNEALKIVEERKLYFTNIWNILNMLLAVTSLVFFGCFIYRFAIVAHTVEELRSSYYEKYVSVSFITFWDEMLRSLVAILLFLSFGKCLHLLRFNPQFAIFGEVYRKAKSEMLIFSAIFCVLLAAYTSLGHSLFGSIVMTFRDLWSSLLGVTALMTGSYSIPEFHSRGQTVAVNVYLFTFCVFAVGFLISYMVAVLSHYFRTRKRRRPLIMSGMETILFYWYQFQLWTGLQQPIIEEEPVVILPPEFTMAEIEYQVDELLFRMNALTGTHGLPEKPPLYLTDSDCTYGAGDDGISSAGSETAPGYMDDRLEQRVQKIEDNLCSQEPFLAQLLKFDTLGAEDLSQEREKQLRSHLELEIFRQLQIQRQDLKSPTDGANNKGGNPDAAETEIKVAQIIPHSPGQVSTSSDEVTLKTPPPKLSKPRRTRSHLKVQTIHDLIAKTTHDLVESHDNSSSNPDSPRDKLAFAKLLKTADSSKIPTKQTSSSSSSEKISQDLSLTHTNSSETETIKKPTKPTFLHSRESSLSEVPKGSPIMKLRTLALERGQRSETLPLGHLESSSGSDQDSLQIGKKLFGRRSLRKTKSRGKGKGPDSLEPALILDELEGEEVESSRLEIEIADLLSWEPDNTAKNTNNTKADVKEYLVTADIHQSK